MLCEQIIEYNPNWSLQPQNPNMKHEQIGKKDFHTNVKTLEIYAGVCYKYLNDKIAEESALDQIRRLTLIISYIHKIIVDCSDICII